MPNREQILAGLGVIAHRMQAIASAWHILAFIALIALVSGWRPPRRTIAVLLVPPLLSVAVAAWIHRSAFNGTIFSLLAIVLAVLGWRIPSNAPGRPPRWAFLLGIVMAVFGLVYPHFIDGGSLFWYLYGAPLGLLPCPTLSFLIGVALITDGLGARAWSLVLATAGLFYGLFGVARLGVLLDLALVLGAAGLLARDLGSHRQARAQV